MRIHEVVAAKPVQAVVTVPPTATVRDLVTLLAEHNVGALVVSADGEHVEGIVSERDVVRRLHADAAVLDTQVGAIMTTDVHSCSPDDSLDELMTLMTEHRVRHVPVCEGDRLVGIVSIGDVVKHKISVLQFERDALEGYVHQT